MQERINKLVDDVELIALGFDKGKYHKNFLTFEMGKKIIAIIDIQTREISIDDEYKEDIVGALGHRLEICKN